MQLLKQLRRNVDFRHRRGLLQQPRMTMMSATQMNGRLARQTNTEVRAGMLALNLLRLTLVGVAVALVGTIGSVMLKVMQG